MISRGYLITLMGMLWHSLSALVMYILGDVPRILKKNQKKSKKFLDILIR